MSCGVQHGNVLILGFSDGGVSILLTTKHQFKKIREEMIDPLKDGLIIKQLNGHVGQNLFDNSSFDDK